MRRSLATSGERLCGRLTATLWRHTLLSPGVWLGLSTLALLALGALAPATAIAADARPTPTEREVRAQLTPKRYTTLAAEVGAKIQSLPVQEGGWFKNGQTLVSFDCSLQQSQAQKAKAVQNAADATLKSTARLSELNSAGKLELELAQTEAAKARADVSYSTVMLSKCQVAAPFAGRVSEQKVREQQYVQPGQALLEIIDDSTLELEFIAPSQWMAVLKVNSLFEIRIDETGRTYPATIVRTAARVDPVSQSVKFVGAIRGRFPDLIAGMSGRVMVTPPAAVSSTSPAAAGDASLSTAGAKPSAASNVTPPAVSGVPPSATAGVRPHAALRTASPTAVRR